MDYKVLLDEVGWQILAALQENARLSFAELGRLVGLSPPAVAERVHRLEEAGVITGYRAQVSPEGVGLPIMAFIQLQTSSDRYPDLKALVQGLPNVVECHHIAGTDAFMLKVVAESVLHLEEVIDRFGGYGKTTTSIVLSSPLLGREPGREALANQSPQ